MTGAASPLGRHRWVPAVTVLFSALLFAVSPAQGQSLRGSAASLDIQNRVARQHDFSFLRTAAQVKRFVELGYLERVRPGRDFDLHAVSFPYARPEVALFIRRLAPQYRAACGEKLVVTSLTRPLDRQPKNASDRSVHPTGMAVDLRWSQVKACRNWLEGVLLNLERAHLLEATRERFPPHYHVALFPHPYASYVQRMVARTAQARVAPAPRKDPTLYRIRPGDSLWTIARSHGTSVSALKAQNDLHSNRIFAGQFIKLPSSR